MGGLRVLDVTDPTLPSLLLSYAPYGQGYGCTFAGELIWLADGTSCVRAIALWDWGAPVTVSIPAR